MTIIFEHPVKRALGAPSPTAKGLTGLNKIYSLHSSFVILLNYTTFIFLFKNNDSTTRKGSLWASEYARQ